jgi:hypothetical protein
MRVEGGILIECDHANGCESNDGRNRTIMLGKGSRTISQCRIASRIDGAKDRDLIVGRNQHMGRNAWM